MGRGARPGGLKLRGMSFGQGGPSWGGPGSPGDDPYGPGPYGRQTPYGPQDPSYGQQDPYGQDPFTSRDTYESRDAHNTPDWAAMADATAQRTRRKRWMLIGGGALATVTVAAIVATAVVSTNDNGKNQATGASGSELPTAGEILPDESGASGPAFPSADPLPPPDPKDFVSSADKDRAPIGADTLYPGRKLTMGGRTYEKGPTTTTTNCAAAAQGSLGSILAANSCDEVIRATYSKDGVAVTVGVALFPQEAQALKAKDQANGGIASLSGEDVPTFCRAPSVCRKTTNSYGRYVYFTVAGWTSGRNVTTSDKPVFTAGDDIAEFTFRQIVARGKAQASAAATAPVSR